MSERESILAGLAPLFAEARAKRLWFFSSYQSIWFSPDELEAEHKNNKFLWGAVNWQLVDPLVKLKLMDEDIAAARATREAFIKRLVR